MSGKTTSTVSDLGGDPQVQASGDDAKSTATVQPGQSATPERKAQSRPATKASDLSLDEVRPHGKDGKNFSSDVVAKGGARDLDLSGEMVVMRISSDRNDGGSSAQPVQLNGFMYNVPRDKDVRVPMEVAHIIENAVESVRASEEIKLDGDVEMRDRNRFSYSVRAA